MEDNPNTMKQDKKVYCIQCGHELKLEKFSNSGDFFCYTYSCSNCGCIEECYADDDEIELGNEFSGCVFCGGALILESNFQLSELLCDTTEDDDSIVYSFECCDCGSSIELIECKPSERSKYKFYNESNN